MSGPLISVVVPTYNRAQVLSKALGDLCAQTLAPDECEIVVVDNNSTDNTSDLVHTLRKSRPNVRYFRERRQGVAYARNLGWMKSRGLYVAQTDDDCEFPRDWLKTAKEIITNQSPLVFGGGYRASYAGERPSWLRDNYGAHFPFEQAQALTRDNAWVLFGCNLFAKRCVYETVGGFNEMFGMSGGDIGYGEETEFIRKITSRIPEATIYFDPGLYVYNVVRSEQMTLGWMARSSFAYGKSDFLLRPKGNAVPFQITRFIRRAFGSLTRLIGDISIGAVFRDYTAYPYIQNYLCEHSFRHVRKLGYLYAELRNRRGPDGFEVDHGRLMSDARIN